MGGEGKQPGRRLVRFAPRSQVNANMAVDNAFNIARPPRLSRADSPRMSSPGPAVAHRLAPFGACAAVNARTTSRGGR